MIHDLKNRGHRWSKGVKSMWFYEALANFVCHVFAWHVGEGLICRTIPSLYLFSVRVFASCNGLLQSLHALRPSVKNPNSTTLLPSCHDITAEEASAAVSRSSLPLSVHSKLFAEKGGWVSSFLLSDRDEFSVFLPAWNFSPLFSTPCLSSGPVNRN